MKVRKNPKVSLENKRKIFFQIGMIIALISVFAAFEYRSYEKYELTEFNSRSVTIVEDFTEVTIQKPPPPPVVKQPQKSINVIEDNREIIDDVPIIDAFGDENTVVEELPEIVEEVAILDDIIFSTAGVEIMPEFPGGYSALMTYLSKSITYPRQAKELNITGTVFVKFIVEKDGSNSNVIVIRGVEGGCSEEAIKAVENMPAWTPGSQWGKPVRCEFVLPVKFSLR